MRGFSQQRGIGLCAGGPDDADASRAATIIGAYFDFEQARASCRLVWRATAILGLTGSAIEVATKLLTVVDVAFGGALLVGVATAAAVAQWRARLRLRQALQTMG